MDEKTRKTIERFKADGIAFLEEPPEGWRKIEGALTAPNGWEWWGKGSRFDGTHQHALVRDRRHGDDAL